MQGIEIYEENADQLVLEKFVLEHRVLVKKIALHIKKKLPSHIELDDLLQAGFVGLLEARKQYKSNMGTAIETYASIRIRGAIIDSLRKNSWGARETLRNMRLINEAVSRIEQRGQKQATSEEVAEELGISLDEHLMMCQQISMNSIISIDMLEDENMLIGDEEENPSFITQKDDIIQHIKQILVTLPEREQLVLSLYYIEEFTFKQIGEILDLTEARICQLHSQAISRLKIKLDREWP